MKSLHHVGYVVDNIESYKKSFVGMDIIKAVHDPLQNANIELLTVGHGSCIELVQPLGPQAFTWNFLNKNGSGLHHVCYEGYSLNEIEELILKHRMLKLRGPLPAILFGRDVIFAMSRSRAIVEFIL
jgi:methylmalonyl-CoA/ethylmalonyl-CoA epimerase